MSWHSFRELLDEVFVTDDRLGSDLRHVRTAVASLGASLGHWDVVNEGQSAVIYASPPAVCQLPARGLPIAILSGSRSPDTYEATAAAAARAGVKLHLIPQEELHPYAPARIVLSGDSTEQIARVAMALGVTHRPEPAAWGMIQACGSVDRYRAGLQWVAEADLNWRRFDYDPDMLHFVPRPVGSPRDGLVLSTYEHPSGWSRQERLWMGEMSAIATRDWARFVVLADRGRKAISYDHTRGNVTVPRVLPLPTIAARSLTLCSGKPPLLEEGSGLGTSVYTEVPQCIATTLLAKLAQVDAGGAESGREAQ